MNCSNFFRKKIIFVSRRGQLTGNRKKWNATNELTRNLIIFNYYTIFFPLCRNFFLWCCIVYDHSLLEWKFVCDTVVLLVCTLYMYSPRLLYVMKKLVIYVMISTIKRAVNVIFWNLLVVFIRYVHRMYR